MKLRTKLWTKLRAELPDETLDELWALARRTRDETQAEPYANQQIDSQGEEGQDVTCSR
jgi:hypothetical protein